MPDPFLCRNTGVDLLAVGQTQIKPRISAKVELRCITSIFGVYVQELIKLDASIADIRVRLPSRLVFELNNEIGRRV